ncbi:DUF6364 family protein [Aurantimonas marianensis]|uniref:DUF6364 family protein n=1 Tax=Aurantimonas marianensis TaxID=2920428 RepID=A0A9X2H831_9HYPH|nr:DUF6364 family protein [Aurantimonas marianensis]MCP3057142.1 DUF6364 family protein [Aurantimonas marianensis]
MVKNITLAVDEEVLRRVRAIAHDRGTSLNALVREHLEQLSQAKDDERRQYKEALAQLREMSARSGVSLGEGYKFTREDAYEGRLR